jgi:hypothetical protein
MAYKEALKNGTATFLMEGEHDAPGQNALPSRSRGKKSTKANLAREASALALSEALKAMLTDF